MFKKFRDWLAFNPPAAASIDDWNEFDERYRDQAPIRHYFYKTFPRKYWWPIKHRWERIEQWTRYRVARYHILDTGLEPGYYDKDTLMLNVNFNLLKDFVEVEKAWMEHVCNDTPYEINPLLKLIPFYKSATFSSRELGMAYLKWETTLDDPKLDKYSQSPEQARVAREIIELYTWWVDVRPARVELEYDYPDEDDDDKPDLYMLSDKWKEDHPDETRAFREWSDAHHKQEEEWHAEDEAMLIRLIKIRRSLWT